MKDTISRICRDLESEHSIKILFAVENGSREIRKIKALGKEKSTIDNIEEMDSYIEQFINDRHEIPREKSRPPVDISQYMNEGKWLRMSNQLEKNSS